jgi:HEPN domain-containing protein
MTRYPGPYEPVTEADYRRAVEMAEAVVAWATTALTTG